MVHAGERQRSAQSPVACCGCCCCCCLHSIGSLVGAAVGSLPKTGRGNLTTLLYWFTLVGSVLAVFILQRDVPNDSAWILVAIFFPAIQLGASALLVIAIAVLPLKEKRPEFLRLGRITWMSLALGVLGFLALMALTAF
jgi:hypothetical protein